MKNSKSKKFLSAIAVLAISGTVAVGAATASACKTGKSGDSSGNVYYVAADGKSTNDGKSISKAKDPSFMNSVDELKPGDTVYLVPGTYNWDTSWGANHGYNSKAIVIRAKGAPGKTINFINAAYDSKSGYTGSETLVTLDFSDMEFDGSNRGVQVYGDYIYWYGIDVCGAGDNGMYIGGSYNTIEYSEFYNNRDTGLQLGRRESAQTNINQWPSYNLIKNCTSHNNYDDETYGENADGFAAKLTIGYGNVFDGCISYRNSDDGWDLYAKSDSGNIGCVIIYNCVAFENGYLEYTQDKMHELLNYKDEYDEPVTNSYKTRDGDGNGFKLGGSVMEGDVKMYNCLSFQNRMHGVTDNSNPGYLKVEGVTSYDNSAAIDNDPNSPTFGQIISTANDDTHGNIDVARQSYSYNTVKNVLSVKSSIAKSLDNDAYRGSVMNSLLNAGDYTNVIKGSVDASTKGESGAVINTSQVNALSATDVFVKLPVEKSGNSYTHNISGLKDLDKSAAERVHNVYRNEDNSINMGDILAIKDGFDFSTYLGSGVTAGSTLNKGSWEDYAHFTSDDLLAGVSVEVYATLLKAQETLTINTDEEQVYQDFEVPSKILDATIDWTTDSELLKIGKSEEVSRSDSRYITIGITRPTDKDTDAKLTATITYLGHSISKTFDLTIKKDNPRIGALSVKVAETGLAYSDGGKIIMDAYRQYAEPTLQVENGAYYNGTLLTAAQYTVKTTYEYATDANAPFETASSFAVNHAGVYKITHKVTLADGSDSASMSYLIFVASSSANVDFDADGSSVSVFRDGYIISGGLSNATGYLYTLTSKDRRADITPANIKELTDKDGDSIVLSDQFRDTSISFSYNNPNNEGYYIYYALGNLKGEVTSEIYEVQIGTVNISNAADFMKVAGGGKVGSEEVSHTIYLLTDDISFAGVANYSVGSSAFTGLLNGQGHTVSHVTLNGEAGKNDTGLFYKVEGGTIMNIKFDDIRITSAVKGSDGGQRTAIVASVYGGYFHNIAITNLYVYGANQRTGGLIGQVFDGNTPCEVSQISIINPIPKLSASGRIADGQNEDELYYISSPSNRVGGIIGFIQSQSTMKGTVEVTVEDCYVESYLATATHTVSSIVAEYDENGKRADALLRGAEFTLNIKNCVSAGVLISTGSSGRIGGILGYHKAAGYLRISGCLAIHDMYYGDALLETSQKNQSPVVGNYNDAADVRVSNCLAYFEEYNSNYAVNALSEEEMSSIIAFSGAAFNTETKWTFIYDEDGDATALKAPYLKLNFLGDWGTDSAD